MQNLTNKILCWLHGHDYTTLINEGVKYTTDQGIEPFTKIYCKRCGHVLKSPILKELEMSLQKFGIDLRRQNDTTKLYDDVGIALKNYGIIPNGGHVSDGVKITAIRHSLQSMLNGGHFNICAIKECAEMAGIIINSDRLLIYKTVHCMDWSEMTPEYRQVLVSMVLDDFKIVLAPKNNNNTIQIS